MEDKELIEGCGALLVLDDSKHLGKFDRLLYLIIGLVTRLF